MPRSVPSADDVPDDSPEDVAPERAGRGERAGDVIDRYTLVAPLGEGGMGTVWLAEQREPVRREVALKIIKLGMDTREVVVRFEAERQALALMDHPGIAKVLDGGATEAGRPYFVMERVGGVPITDHCAQHEVGLRERLALFVRVCEAVQHAHQKGVIHRDIKPSNVLVAEVDGVPTPVVIDFGIAKATSAELTQKTLLTQHAQIIGTPEYMAPEQADPAGVDIDTRADVYSLGVLLYELLTGTKPFDVRTVLESGYEELLRTIREVDPVRPSTRVSTTARSASAAPSGRAAEVTALGRHLRGDLDWIVMKALEKDRARRYETASGLAADVERHLADEPIVAAPPSAAYRVAKLVRRRRKTVAALAVIVLLVVAGTIGTGVGWWRTVKANASLDEALVDKAAALEQEEQQRRLAQANAALARDEADRAARAEADARARADEFEAVAAFQEVQLGSIEPFYVGQRLRRTLLEAAPLDARAGLEVALAGVNFTELALRTLEENLFQRTIEAIDAEFADQPLVRARLLMSQADTLLALGLFEAAWAPQQRAEALRRAELGDDHAETLSAVTLAGRILHAQGHLERAEQRLRRAWEGRRATLGEEHADTVRAASDLGTLLRDQGRFDGAEVLYRQVADGFRRTLGEDSEEHLIALANLALLLQDLGDHDAAERAYRDVLERMRRVLGDDHPHTLSAINGLGLLLKERGELEEAELLSRHALERRRLVIGDDHPDTLVSLNNVGAVLQSQGRYAEAEPYYRETYEKCRRDLGALHFHTLAALNNLALLATHLGRAAESLALYREVVDGSRRVLGPRHVSTLASQIGLGNALHETGELEEAVATLQEAVTGLRAARGEEHRHTQVASTLLEDALRDLVSAAGDERARGEALAARGAHLVGTGRPAQAEPPLHEACGLLFGALGADDERPWRAQSLLGAAVAAQGRFAEAEPALLESAERLDALGVDASSAAERAAELYRAWDAAEPGSGHAAGAEAWRARAVPR